MGRKSKRVRVDLEFARISKEICEDTKLINNLKVFDTSDLTAKLTPLLIEIKKKMGGKR